MRLRSAREDHMRRHRQAEPPDEPRHYFRRPSQLRTPDDDHDAAR